MIKYANYAKASDYTLCLLLCIFSFLIFYYGNELLAERKESSVILAFRWEERIPYVSFFFIIYYGVFILPILIPLFIKRKRDLYTLTKQIILANFIAGTIFFLFNTKSMYSHGEVDSTFWKITHTLTGKHNLFPSLHVALSLIILKPIKINLNKYFKIFLNILAILLLLSTLFTHQHQVLDVLGGIILYVSLSKMFPYEFQNHL